MNSYNRSELLLNLDKFHTTNLGILRVRRNLSVDVYDVVGWWKEKIQCPNALITRKGKNWYVDMDNCELTFNAYSYTIITAHKRKNR